MFLATSNKIYSGHSDWGNYLAYPSTANFDLNTYYGNYTIINAPWGSISNFNTHGEILELHNTTTNLVSSNTKIGTAKVTRFAFDSTGGNQSDANTYIYRTFLTDINVGSIFSLSAPGAFSFE